MQDIFNQDGHLTEYALKAIINDELDEISRLEISEHLSFCDECIIRYTELLTDEVLIEPLQPTVPTIMQKIKRTTAIIFLNKYVTMTIAASIALVLWVTGVFDLNSNDKMNKLIANIETTSNSLSETTSGVSDGISKSISNIFEIFNNKENKNNEKK